MPAQGPIVTPDTNSPAHGSPDEAADAVSKSFGGTPTGEQAAVIFQRPDGSHVYSTIAPQTDHDSFALRAQMPKGYKLSGIVHAHPGQDDQGQVFSPNDLNVANQLKVPSYIRFLKDNSIRKYTPGKTATQDYRMDGQVKSLKTWQVAKGDPLDNAGSTAPAQAQNSSTVEVSGNMLLGTVGEEGSISGAVSGAGSSSSTTPTESNPVTPGGQVNTPNDPAITGTTSNTLTPSGSSAPTPNYGALPGTTAAASNGSGVIGSNTAGASTDLSVPPLGSLTPQAPPVSNYSPTDVNIAGQGVAAPIGMLTQAQTAAQAPVAGITNGQINPNDATNSASQLDAITNDNSPYIQLAKQQGLLTAAGRGLENSSLAAGSSEAAATAAAAPLAQQNASGATQSALQEQQLQTQTSEFNASQQDAAQELSAQLGTSVSQSNAQLRTANDQFNAQQTQAAAAANAAATNTMAAQTAALTEDMNKQDLSGTQSARLAQIQADSNQLIASNQSASSMYSNFLNSMSATMANQNISPTRAADTITAMQSMLQSGLNVIDQMNGMSLDITMPTTVGSGAGLTTYNPAAPTTTSNPVGGVPPKR